MYRYKVHWSPLKPKLVQLRIPSSIPSWENNSRSAYQEWPCLLRNSNVHYRTYKSPLMISILSLMNRVYNVTHPFFKIRFNIILLNTLRTPKWFILLIFLTNLLQAFLIYYYVLHALSISPSVIWSSCLHLLGLPNHQSMKRVHFEAVVLMK
jgi:hypothetical protein